MTIPVWTECTSPQSMSVILLGPWMPMGIGVQIWAECEQAAPTYTECSATATSFSEKTKVAPTWTEGSV